MHHPGRVLALLAALLSVALLMSGCSSSSSSKGASKQDYVDAMLKTYSPSSDPFTKSQAKCLAGGIVDAVGVDKLQSVKLSPKQLAESNNAFTDLGKKLTTAEAGKVSDVLFGGKCIEPAALLAQDLPASIKQLSSKQQTCFVDQLAKTPQFKASVTNQLLGKSASDPFQNDPSSVTTILQKCNISPAQLGG